MERIPTLARSRDLETTGLMGKDASRTRISHLEIIQVRDYLFLCFFPPHRFCIHGPHHKDAVEELVRREVERCDRLAGLMTMMSVAGGTGSGVGTYITQCLRDIYPSSFVLNHLTWPFGTGEVCIIYSHDKTEVFFFFWLTFLHQLLPGDPPEL